LCDNVALITGCSIWFEIEVQIGKKYFTQRRKGIAKVAKRLLRYNVALITGCIIWFEIEVQIGKKYFTQRRKEIASRKALRLLYKTSRLCVTNLAVIICRKKIRFASVEPNKTYKKRIL